MRQLTHFAVSAVVSICAVSLFGAPPEIRVAIELSGEPDVRETLSSFLRRELRELQNVVIVEQEAHLKLHVVAMKIVLASGRQTGYTLAVAITQRQDPEFVRVLVDTPFLIAEKRRLSDEEWARISWFFEDKEDFRDLWLRTFPVESLRTDCAELIAQFDVRYVEPQRQVHQMSRDRPKVQGERKPN